MSNLPTCLMVAGALALTGCAVSTRFSGAPGATSPWAYHRGTSQSLGADTSGNFNGKLKVVWQRNLKDRPVGPITLVDGMLYYPSSKKKFRVIDPATGRTVAQFKTRGVAQTGGVSLDSMLFVGLGPFRNEMVARNCRSGATRWTVAIKDVSNGSILVDKRLIVGDGDRRLRALDISTGRDSWSVELEGKPVAPPSSVDKMIIQPTDRGYVYAVSVDSGRVMYRVKLESSCVGAAACGGLIYVGDVSGRFYALSPSDGRIEWQKTLDGPIWSPPAVGGSQVYVVHSGGRLFAFDGATGRDLWSYSAGEVIKAPPMVAGEYAVIGTLTGRVLTLRSSDGAVVDSASVTGPISASPVTDGNRVYIATDQGRLVCFGETDAVNAETGNTGAVERRPE